MTENDLAFLLSDPGQQLLTEFSGEVIDGKSELACLTRLRKSCTASQASALLTTLRLRRAGEAKFSRAGTMYFTPDALEQASAEIVTSYRSQRFAGASRILDLCCGIGGDAIGLAAHAPVCGLDLDPVRLRMAQENLRAYDLAESFTTARKDVTTLDWAATGADAWFVDPARRTREGNDRSRIFDPEKCSPSLSDVLSWRRKIPHGGVKLGPGLDHDLAPADSELEFISVKNEVREAVLWFGRLADPGLRRATLLPSGETLTARADSIPPSDVAPVGAWLYEPDKAVIRARLVTVLAEQCGAKKIDGEIAYLTADREISSPFWTRYAVRDVIPFSRKSLTAYLRQHGIGEVVLKKRGSRADLETLRSSLKLKGSERAVVILTHAQGHPVAIIASAPRTNEPNI